jgi:hypothetical protein
MVDREDMDDEVDYLHPFGKTQSTKGEEIKEGDEAKPSAKNFHYALQEADGHSMVKNDPFLHPESAMSETNPNKEPLE